MTLQDAIRNYGQLQFNLGVATLQLEQAIAAQIPVIATPEPETEETEEA